MTTKFRIAEQVQRMLRGNPIISGRVHKNDVKLLIEQVSNQLLKADYFAVSTPEGDTIPNNCMVFTYDNVPVTTYKTKFSTCKLPAIPVNLPRNMGVLQISKIDCIDEPFIPIPTSMSGIFKPSQILADTQISYEIVGGLVIFNKNLPGLGINSVYIRLVGVDISQLSDYDLLPLAADREVQVIQQVYNILVQTPPADRSQNIND